MGAPLLEGGPASRGAITPGEGDPALQPAEHIVRVGDRARSRCEIERLVVREAILAVKHCFGRLSRGVGIASQLLLKLVSLFLKVGDFAVELLHTIHVLLLVAAHAVKVLDDQVLLLF